MSMGPVPAVAVSQLRRVYERGRKPPSIALAGLDLTIPQGEVHGLLGPNGAGKTTLCKILSTILLPTSGRVEILGHDVVARAQAVRPLIGIAFGGERGLHARLTARQNLLYWSALHKQRRAVGRERTTALLERFGLADRADDRVETFSRGMKQRLHLARCLIGDPKVVILDEPTSGMDPVAAHEFRVLVGELRTDGRTVLVTTHDMTEAEAICDRVSLIDHGSLLGTENPRTIGTWLSTYEQVTAAGVAPEVVDEIRNLPGVTGVRVDGGTIVVEVGTEGTTNDVLRVLVATGVTTVATRRPSLEEVYLNLMGDRRLAVR